jgi:hypothetical protein
MLRLSILVFVLALSASPAMSQTTENKGVRTPRSESSPFGSDWAKPYPQTGGFIYNDPRTQSSNQPLRPHVQTRCRGGFNPNTLTCR